ncbi:pyridoxamine 5'-phosphate oxidase family protein [Mucilaginibacter terrae]|uniref:pyridoxamine 5'-phosphate oxidase family protein n=1 Tax=Mucilaginibacter terrae TaxID=1955052 RepID=UPI003636EFA6
MNNALNEIFADSWNKITGEGNRGGKVTRTITVCNYAPDYINAYTVVLREASYTEGSLLFYTDIRSEKVAEIKRDNRLTLITYNEEDKQQLIFKGTAFIYHQNATTQQYWNKDGFKGRRSYMAQPAPSSVINEPVDGLEYLEGKDFDETDMQGYENFAVIKVQINLLEWLKLSRDGNRRAKFNLYKDSGWQGQWLIP